MSFELSFGGIPFGIDTPEINQWVDERLPLNFLRELVQVPEQPSYNLQALAVPKWPDKPPLRIGDFFYPTGMTRWGEFHGLADRATVDAMRNIAFNHNYPYTNGSVPLPFVMISDNGLPLPATDDGSGISTLMYMLPPRPLGDLVPNPNAFEPEAGLFLVTLVDDRYWRLLRSPVTLGFPGSQQTWAQVLNQIVSVDLAISLTYGFIPPVYGLGPDFDSGFWANQESSSALLDAVAFNLGMVVSRSLSTSFPSSYRLIPINDTTRTITEEVQLAAGYRIAGGDLMTTLDEDGLKVNGEGVLPRIIRVTFPNFINWHSYVDRRHGVSQVKEPYGDVWVVDTTLQQAGQPYSLYNGTPGHHELHDTAKAYWNVNPGDDALTAPLNQSQLQALALQLAKDYWDSLLTGRDEVYPGIRKWIPGPIHDVIFSMRGGENATAETRVMRKPWNFQVKYFQHRLDPCTTGSSFVLDTDNDPGDSDESLESEGSYVSVTTCLTDGPNCSPCIELVRIDAGVSMDAKGRSSGYTQKWNSELQAWQDVELVFVRPAGM